MGDTHGAIHTLTTDFANSALERILPQGAARGTSLSPTEYFSFCRAFYRVELFYTLSRGGASEKEMNLWFLSRHAPWENEQLGSVYENLDARFAEASFDVLAHDILFGELSVDYLTAGEDNPWRETWLSQGVEFVYKLTIADSYDAKHTLLQSALGSSDGKVDLPACLRGVLGDVDDRPLKNYSEEELHPIAPCHSASAHPEDTDRGPYEAWRDANGDLTLEASLLCTKNAWLRERAYVFWDQDRVRSLKDGFGKRPGYPAEFPEREYQDMFESFDERSKIWQKGGGGYWSKGDTSRVIWS